MSSNRKHAFNGFGGVAVVAGQVALPTPAVFYGDAAAAWHTGRTVPGRFDIEMIANGTVALTDVELLGVVQDQIEIASDDIDTVDFANNELDIASHGLLKGYGPMRLTTTGTIPAGLALLTDYYVIKQNAGTIKLALTLHDAMEGTAVAFTNAGSGTHSILGSELGTPFAPDSNHSFLTGSNNAFRPIIMSYGLLGPAADGAVDLTATEGYTTSVEHRPRTVLYAVQATHPGTIEVGMTLYSVDDV